MANSALGRFFARRRPAVDWAVVPATTREIDAVVRHCRRIVSRRALVAAGVSAVPLPGIDWVTDVAILMRLIPDINQAFGLTPEQIERLAPDRQVVVYKAISAGGGMLIGKLVTRDLVVQLLRFVGVRLTAQQAASAYARGFQDNEVPPGSTAEGFAGLLPEDVRDRYREAFARSDLGAMLNYYKRNYPRAPYEDIELPNIKAPVLVVHGLGDQFLLAEPVDRTMEAITVVVNWAEELKARLSVR